MSTLDQAFVKAYEQPPAVAGSSTYAPLLTMSSKPAAQAAESVKEASVAATLAEAPASVPEAAIKTRPPRTRSSRERRSTPSSTASRTAARSASPARTHARASREKSAPAHAARSAGGSPSKIGGRFRPLLEVDGYLWPKSVGLLAAPTQEAMEQLIENILERIGRNQKVVGWQGCRPGDGCSTLLLAVARRLAGRGLSVAMVDADFRHPGLARRLGLTPTAGWEEVVAGRLSLAEVVVESLRDGVSVAPWCASAAEEETTALAEASDPASLLEELRRNYDVVLVDLGRGRPSSSHADLLASLRSRLDAVLVVHNVGEVPTSELERACQRLSRAGKAELAVVENFV